jgi:4-diphosphocytidyl-2-C-methyl-D-erythritol kinase
VISLQLCQERIASLFPMSLSATAPAPPFFTLSAPAKINLWLRVLGRREDGFHALETRLVPLALGDELTLTPHPDATPGTILLTCDDPTVPGDESNLVIKAIRALEKTTGPLPGMAFSLTKRVPHGAGLGGGSSDAAAALRLVRAAFLPDLPDSILVEAAAAVGSDIPFFLSGGAADASGRGEIVEPVPAFSATSRVLLVKLPFGIPTPWAYRQWKDSMEVPGLPYAAQESGMGLLVNDLERPVFEKYQVLGHLKAALLATPGVTAALMSGSGSTVFALVEENAQAGTVEAAVMREVGAEVDFYWTRLAPGLPEIRTQATDLA